MSKPLVMQADQSVVDHITAGLGKIATALRSQAWEGGGTQKLTPTQGQILVLLAQRQTMRLNDVARELCMTAATASDAVIALEEKKLVRKGRSSEDLRALTISLTAAGRREAERTSGWTGVVKAGVASLTQDEQAAFLRGLTKVIRSLQDQGVISVARMCAGCTYFQPYVHADAAKPHHCGFVNAPLGEGHLRLDCPDFLPVSETDRADRWQTFVSGHREP